MPIMFVPSNTPNTSATTNTPPTVATSKHALPPPPREATPTTKEAIEKMRSNLSRTGQRWRRSEQLNLFRRFATERGYELINRPIPYRAKLVDNEKLRCDKARDILRTGLNMLFPRFIMRWRTTEEGWSWTRVTLILSGAHVKLPGWDDVDIFFDWGRKREDDASPYEGLRHYFHRHPHAVANSFNFRTDDNGPKQFQPSIHLNQVTNEEACFGTYFWVDFFEPEQLNYDSLNATADALLDLAVKYAHSMPKTIEPHTELHKRCVAKVIKGAAASLKKSAISSEPTIRRLVESHEEHREQFTKEFQRVGRWAIRTGLSLVGVQRSDAQNATLNNIETTLRTLINMKVQPDAKTVSQHKSYVRVLCGIKMGKELSGIA